MINTIKRYISKINHWIYKYCDNTFEKIILTLLILMGLCACLIIFSGLFYGLRCYLIPETTTKNATDNLENFCKRLELSCEKMTCDNFGDCYISSKGENLYMFSCGTFQDGGCDLAK